MLCYVMTNKSFVRHIWYSLQFLQHILSPIARLSALGLIYLQQLTDSMFCLSLFQSSASRNATYKQVCKCVPVSTVSFDCAFRECKYVQVRLQLLHLEER